MEYSLAIALEDFIPVVLSALGFVWLARRLAERAPAVGPLAGTGAALIVLGGFSKALWKLIIAATGADVSWLANSLFPLMAPGFLCLAWALWRGLRAGKTSAASVWLAPLAGSALALSAAAFIAFTKGGRGWVMILLAVTTLGNLLLSLQLIADSWRRGLLPAALLFAYNLATIFLQARMARMEQTIALQWIEQLNNTLSWAAFAAAVWFWRKETR
jgi:hypothetical protein